MNTRVRLTVLWLCAVLLIFGVLSQDDQHFRLPTNTRPTGYDVTLTVDLEKFQFFGSVRISLVATARSNNVTVNVNELDISKVTLTEQTGKILTMVGSVLQNDSEMAKFTFDSDLSTEYSYQMMIEFAGNISDDLKGLYKSSYYRETEERFIGTTFNAAAYARKIFPCYDEPHLKAKFKLRVYHEPQFHVLSNMPVENRTEPTTPDNNGMSLTTFAESEPMSSYLFAFVVSDFSALTLGDTYAAHAQPSVINSTQYALDFTQSAISYLGTFFRRPYQLPKLDIVAVDDFLMGAMENWGLITYKTSRIVYRSGQDKTEKLQSVTKIVFHELLHQWFGNEVTCAWWSYVWLNEGFAVFLESYILNEMRPEWRLMDQFLVDEMHPVMLKDSLPRTRAMTKPINTPEEIAGIYDFVAYPKAASVIRMLHSVVGKAVFDEFLVDYLKDRSFKSSTEDDMIRVLQDTVDRRNMTLPPLDAIVKSWTQNPSYPLVTVNWNLAGSVTISSVPVKMFHIPLDWISESGKSGRDWLLTSDSHKTILLENLGSDEWILVNPHQYGYYRVNYDSRNWQRLINTLNKDYTKIPVLSRAQLIDDALFLARNNHLGVETLLRLLSYISKESDLIPLKSGFKALTHLNQLFRGNDLYPSYLDFQHKLLETIYDRMLLNKADDHLSKLYRVEVRRVACELSLPKCLGDAIGLFEEFELIEPDLRAPVICGSIKASEHPNVWLLVVRRLAHISRNFEQKRINVEEFEDILYGFGCVASRDRVDNYLSLSLSDSETLEQSDRIKMFNYVANSGVNGTEEALNRLSNDYQTLRAKYGSMNEIVSNLRNAISTQEQLQQYQNFLQNNTDSDINAILHEVHEEVRTNVQWTKTNLPVISKWILETNSGVSIVLSKFVALAAVIVIAYQSVCV
ncbi:aminopeptidase N-like [Toxorhynchites rutilus septentrionalis]|uniref:aminopeptidase N-like n=1 Tax=Toxorhynchites rutilus septentrionalis TaxID=329112 RepID=UPI00247A3E83|nr:aminopeptidase N-like [Toxorhynchites rutilus septentrionalis]